MITLRYCFCPDSGTIETDDRSPKLFLSRFSHYRDRSSLFETVFVPIPTLSGLMPTLRNCFCPDSDTIGTDDTSSELFSSRFSHYTIETDSRSSTLFLSRFQHYRDRDRFPIFSSFLVPIPALSRRLLALLLTISPIHSTKEKQNQHSPQT